MIEHHAVDITALAVLGEQFPLRLQQMGFRLMQVIDATGQDQFRYVIPPLCDVPAGFFRIGSDKQDDPRAHDNETVQSTIAVPSFQMSAYPVTVAEYECAVMDLAVYEPRNPGNCSWQTQLRCPDHPVVCINWHEATVYAAWLAQVTRQSWRLPTEVEWEKAARGTDGRLYPWGYQRDARRANTTDGGPGEATPIGAYAARGDASPYGVHDMAGNVWEWTSSRYRERPNYHGDPAEVDDDTDAYRVVRGGCCRDSLRAARAAARGSHLPYYADSWGGMRLVLSGPD